MKSKKTEVECTMCHYKFDALVPKEAEYFCGEERPPRDTLCQLRQGHDGRHRALIFWE